MFTPMFRLCSLCVGGNRPKFRLYNDQFVIIQLHVHDQI